MRRFRLTLIWAMTVAALGCRSIPTTSSLPIRHSTVREQLVIYSDFSLPADHRLLDELGAQRYDLARHLRLPITEEPIHVYLFGSPESFQKFIAQNHPGFPQRRAFFVESDTQLGVYAHWGERVAEDLRHEVAHGYLHAAVPRLPLWLDEGLAEYFEVPRGTGGLNSPHLQELAAQRKAGTWQPDLRRLEALESAGDMQQLEYAESWAWVHMLLETTPERRELLQNYLQKLRQDGTAPPLSIALRTLHPNPDQALLAYLDAGPENLTLSATPSPHQSR